MHPACSLARFVTHANTSDRPGSLPTMVDNAPVCTVPLAPCQLPSGRPSAQYASGTQSPRLATVTKGLYEMDDKPESSPQEQVKNGDRPARDDQGKRPTPKVI